MTSSMPEEADRRKRRHRNERIAAAILVGILATLTVLFIRWNRAGEEAVRKDRLYIPKPEVITPEILLLQEYVRIDTSTAEGVAEGARWLAGQLRKGGVEPEIIESAPYRLNVYARIEGRTPGSGLLLFNHIDVVPATAEGWEHPPFEGVIRLNRLYGRGALDMKGMAICQLVAFLKMAQSGRQPEHDVVFLATAEEEHGSADGMQWLLKNRPDLFEGIAYGVTEGGITEMFTERMTYFGIEIGGKQRAAVRLLAPDLETAERMRIAFEPFITSREPDRILPGVRKYLEQIAPARISFGPLLADIDRTIDEGAFWRLPETYRVLMQNNLWIEAPKPHQQGATMLVFLLNLPDETPDDRIRWLEERIAPFGARILETLDVEGPVPLSSDETPLFSILRSAAEERYRTVAGAQILYRSTSDCRFLRLQGIPCYGVSPYPVDIHESVTIHQRNERITLHHFMEGVGYLTAVVEQAGGAK